ncbi:uroporphyrinogen-III synthase [Thiofaba sp. EF100]|uniref:uroporphyrinogen-III synthase n=1 Tax=Thiofaba sp. EF100 TaxID=3121274 RepID=UPI00322167AD
MSGQTLGQPPSPLVGEGRGEGVTLAGQHIAITRPVGQAAPLLKRIQALGGEAIPLPLLKIAPPATPISPDALKRQCQAADLIAFISPNAARMALQILSRAHWPPGVRLACVGQGTARALHAAGFGDVLVPSDGANSEALLALPELCAVRGQRILIVRGEGGRTLLADTLAARGAQVDHAVVYRRLPLPPDLTALRRRGAVTFVITSSEALQVLVNAARDQASLDWLREQIFVFGHPRIAETGRAFGLLRGIIVDSPADDALLTALLGLAQNKR